MSLQSIVAWFGRIPATILHLFTNFMTASEKLYDQLSAQEKAIGEQASAIIAVLNADLKALPDDFWTALSKLYPVLTKDVVTGYMNKLLVSVGAINADAQLSFDDAVKALQTWLGSHTSENAWIAACQSAVSFLIAIISPNTTLVQKITMVLEYIYTHIVKPKVATV